MDRRKFLAGVAASGMLLVGGRSVVLAEEHDGHDSGHDGGDGGPNCQVEAPNGMGMQSSHAAQQWGGIAAATDHHNERHDPDLTVGQHQQMIMEACRVLPNGR